MAKTIVGKILASIAKVVVNLFNKLDDETKRLVPIAINVVEAIKAFNESKSTDFIAFVVTSAIPGDADDILIKKARAVVREWLPKILLDLKLIQSIADLTNDNEKLIAILNELKLTSTKGIIYKGTAAKFLELMADGKFDFNDAVELTSYYYEKITNKLN